MLSSSVSPRESSISPSPKRETPSTPPSESFAPNNLRYYNDHLNKSQFNLILTNCAVNLLKMLYPSLAVIVDDVKLRFFIIEILRRSKASTQTLQICCYYMYKLVGKNVEELPSCPKKLFLALVILSSKFNQDQNYSFKSWLKICGCKSTDDSSLNLQKLRQTETQCLKLLNYDLYINGAKYENWCNVLLIFGYDFITLHHVNSGVLSWCSEADIQRKLYRWKLFLLKMDDRRLGKVAVNFKHYYADQVGTKIVTSAAVKPASLFGKRALETCDLASKRVCN